MKTTTKIAVVVAVLGLVGVLALTNGAFAHVTQENGAGWQGMNGMGMTNNQAGAPANGNAQYATPAGNPNGSTAYCYAHGANYAFDAQTGVWNCPYGCLYGGQTQGATGQQSGYGHCC